ncbi:MAG: radical SAM protein [Patescibacteria group bacterium]|nr:radical SAM protein [Patescibacteria group bacterium]
MKNLTIKDVRVALTDKCDYSCIYCNIYTNKITEGKPARIMSKYYIVGNESYGLLKKPNKNKKRLTVRDYKFIFSSLRINFKTEDITFSGGDPLLHPRFKEVVEVARKEGMRTTAITKGLPLLGTKNEKEIKNKLGNLSRLIISIDTTNPIKYARENLPLMKFSEAKKILPQILKKIKTINKKDYNIEVNSVIKPYYNSKTILKENLEETNKIINFCLKNSIKKIKLIEIDSLESLKRPYIEKYVKKIKASNKNNIKIYPHRTHCPESSVKKVKKCRFSQGGELNIDFMGRSFLCQKNELFKFVDLHESIKERDEKKFINKIIKINNNIEEQKCKMINYERKQKTSTYLA